MIATFVGGIPELVEPGRNGWLVPAGSVDALVGAMREVLSAAGEDLAAMGRAGRERVLARHGTRVAVDALVARLIATATAPGVAPDPSSARSPR